jgi:hypothetical protein
VHRGQAIFEPTAAQIVHDANGLLLLNATPAKTRNYRAIDTTVVDHLRRQLNTQWHNAMCHIVKQAILFTGYHTQLVG